MSIPIRGYQEFHKTVHDGFGREVCERKYADIHFQNLSGARRRVRDVFGFDFADGLSPMTGSTPCEHFKSDTFSHTRWASSPKNMCGRPTILRRSSAAKFRLDGTK